MAQNEEQTTWLDPIAWVRDISSAFREVNATVVGRRILRDIFILGNMYGSSINSDINHTIRLEGRRDVAVFIANLLDPDREAEELLNYFDEIFYRDHSMLSELMKPKKNEDK